MSTLQARLSAIGFLAPGLPDWARAAPVLRGEQTYQRAASVLPLPEALAGAERRRASRVVKLTLAVGLEAVRYAQADARTLATVFAASGSDGYNCHALCEQLATADKQISPTRFHNSVHNAPAGYWGIATQCRAACHVIAAYDASFGAGLLEALTHLAFHQEAVLLIAYDSEYPEPLAQKRPIPDCAAVALLLRPCQLDRAASTTSQDLGILGLAFSAASPDTMPNADLEALRLAIPAMRALPLLRAIALGRDARLNLEYLAPQQLQLTWQALPQ